MILADKSVVLTGASGGIGGCIAHALAGAGARLLLVGRDAVALERLRDDLPNVKPSHQIYVANLRDPQEREDLARTCQDMQIDLLINNAGAGEFNLLEGSSTEAIAALIDLNLNVPIQLTRLLLPLLKSRPSAAVINIGSALGSIGYPGYSAYSATKFGLRGFSEALRRELSDTPVRVMHFAPRATKTALNAANVEAMNAALGTHMDSPEAVAQALLTRIVRNQWRASVFGWPERFYAFMNALNPRFTDGAIEKQLPHIKRFASEESH